MGSEVLAEPVGLLRVVRRGAGVRVVDVPHRAERGEVVGWGPAEHEAVGLGVPGQRARGRGGGAGGDHQGDLGGGADGAPFRHHVQLQALGRGQRVQVPGARVHLLQIVRVELVEGGDALAGLVGVPHRDQVHPGQRGCPREAPATVLRSPGRGADGRRRRHGRVAGQRGGRRRARCAVPVLDLHLVAPGALPERRIRPGPGLRVHVDASLPGVRRGGAGGALPDGDVDLRPVADGPRWEPRDLDRLVLRVPAGERHAAQLARERFDQAHLGGALRPAAVHLGEPAQQLLVDPPAVVVAGLVDRQGFADPEVVDRVHQRALAGGVVEAEDVAELVRQQATHPDARLGVVLVRLLVRRRQVHVVPVLVAERADAVRTAGVAVADDQLGLAPRHLDELDLGAAAVPVRERLVEAPVPLRGDRLVVGDDLPRPLPDPRGDTGSIGGAHDVVGEHPPAVTGWHRVDRRGGRGLWPRNGSRRWGGGRWEERDREKHRRGGQETGHAHE